MTNEADDRLQAELTRIAGSIVEADGAELVDVVVKGHTGSRSVRIIVDAEEGLDVERIARLAREIGAAFDDEDPIPGRYTLQVTSPGADRPLRSARDFIRNAGRPVRIELAAGGSPLEGVVVSADDDTLVVEVDGETVEMPLADVGHARVKLPW